MNPEPCILHRNARKRMSTATTRLKICGITTLADARYCAGAGVDYLGFIQHPESPRYIAPEQAKEIIGWVYGPETVGVFVNEPAASINRIAAGAGFSMVQVHGDQEPGFFDALDRPAIKALSIRPDTDAGALAEEMARFAPFVDYFLLDTAKAGQWGGTGTTFDWAVAREVVEAYDVFVAGGLHAGNIRDVIETLHPFAVDLASGVESAPGVKDFDRLAALFDAFASIRTPSS